MRVLVTAGGTEEPIDRVRVLTNTSTGATGAAIADAFVRAGADVTLLRARRAVSPTEPLTEHLFTSVASLDAACREALAAHPIDLIVHAAAVSDYTLAAVIVSGQRHAAPVTGKLDSSLPLQLELVPGKKILPQLKGYSQNPAVRLVGFKLTDGADSDAITHAVGKVFAAGADIVVHNDLQTMATQRATIWDGTGPIAVCATTVDLAAWLIGYARAR